MADNDKKPSTPPPPPPPPPDDRPRRDISSPGPKPQTGTDTPVKK